MNPHTARDARRVRRRGGVYMLVLLASSIVAVLGTSAVLVARIQNRMAETSSYADDARISAAAAIEVGRLTIQQDPNWRTNRPSGRWVTGQPLGKATFSLDVVDPNDGLLFNSNLDPVVLTGTGARGPARWKTQVTLVARVRAYDCLLSDLTGGGSVTFNGLTLFNASNVCSNGSINASSCTLGGTSFQAVGALNFPSSTGTGARTTLTAPRQFPPDPNAVFNYYATIGTPILYGLLPQQGGSAVLEGQLLTPLAAPFGVLPNLQGVYVIDCAGKPIVVRNCRINGTLVILNPGSASVEQSVNWESYVANYPALMVHGNLTLQTTATPLSESGSGGSGKGVNFNPITSPYHGEGDLDTSDTYPSLVKGLVYVSGNLTTTNRPTVVGCVVVGGTVTGDKELDLTYQDTFAKNPPPGFATPPVMVVQPGSWAHAAK